MVLMLDWGLGVVIGFVDLVSAGGVWAWVAILFVVWALGRRGSFVRFVFGGLLLVLLLGACGVLLLGLFGVPVVGR